MAFVGIPATSTPSTLPRQKQVRRRVLRAARSVTPTSTGPTPESVPVTTDLRLVDDALLDWRSSV